MNILLSNDDGINSKALLSIAKALSKHHNVLIIAPDNNKSTVAHSVTFHKNITINKVDIIPNVKAYKISGTPCDCVKLAKLYFKDFNIDLVVAGINLGHNLASDILYSGTVSIALESAFFGIPSFAFSAYSHDDDYCFDNFSNIAVKIIDNLYKNLKPSDVINVNFPDKNTKINGIKFAPLGDIVYNDEVIKVSNNELIVLGNEIDDIKNLDCDVGLVKKGYVTITPLTFDRTNFKRIKELNFLCEKL